MATHPLIAVVTDHTDYFRNVSLADLFNKLVKNEEYRTVLEKFNFVFTGGTFNRLFFGEHMRSGKPFLEDDTKRFLKSRTIQLPRFEHGGVLILSHMLLTNRCKIMWSFQTPDSPHHLIAQNYALRWVSDIKNVKRLINSASVEYWFNYEAEDFIKKIHKSYDKIQLKSENKFEIVKAVDTDYKIEIEKSKVTQNYGKILAIVVRHDQAENLAIFLNKNKIFFSTFTKILITQPINCDVFDQITFPPAKVIPLSSVEEGGLVEIAIEVIFGWVTHVIIYDEPTGDNYDNPPLETDPVPPTNGNNTSITKQDYGVNAFDYQIVTSACKISQNVEVKMNIAQTNDWIDKTIEMGVILNKNNEVKIKFKIVTDNDEIKNKLYGDFTDIIKEEFGSTIKHTLQLDLNPLLITLTIILPAILQPFVAQVFQKGYERISSFLNKNSKVIKDKENEGGCEELAKVKHQHVRGKKFVDMVVSQSMDGKRIIIINDGKDYFTYECDENGEINYSSETERKYAYLWSGNNN